MRMIDYNTTFKIPTVIIALPLHPGTNSMTSLNENFNRRNLLKYGSTALTAAGITAAAGSKPLHAIEPFKRSEPSTLRVSLSAYSFRQMLTGKATEKMDLFGFVDWCHDHRIAGVELTSYYFPTDVTHDYLWKLKRHCHMRGVTISGGAIRNDYCNASDESIARDLEHTKKWIEYYAFLGAPVIRIFAGEQPKGWTKEQTFERCAKTCELACEHAAKHGILLGLENHGGITALSDDLLAIVKKVESSAFGINFDSGNFKSTDDPYAELAKIAPYAVNAQIKVEMFPNGKRQETDLSRVVKILRDAGYSGWLALEYEAEEDALTAVPKWLEKLHSAVTV
jgi:sugar phosphate isomerase/epimerase